MLAVFAVVAPAFAVVVAAAVAFSALAFVVPNQT